MAVDIKSLRIGSHVEYEGKRVRIKGLTPGCLFDCTIETTDKFGLPALYVLEDGFKDLQPIEITPELLTELGFGCVRHGSFEHWFLGNFDLTHNIGSCYWDYKDDIRLEYLHELEDLYYLIYGKELIND